MFESLSEKFSSAIGNLTRRGALTDADIDAAMREVRFALLEADVSLPVVKSFIRSTRRKATGQAVMRSVAPGNQVIKIVHDELIQVLSGDGEASSELKIGDPPAAVLMVGLQGSGKTTTTAKLAKRISENENKRVLMASLDTNRPAAMEQLEILGQQAEISTLPIVKGQSAIEIARRAKQHALIHGFDVYMLDTAGRLHIDTELMDEVLAVRDSTRPRETLLVVDGLTGQDAVNVAREFDEKVGVSGVVLTRMEGDGRGGAALSMRAVTGKPIKFVGLGEKLDDLGTFDPDRIAGRILGMGDIVALVEKAAETFEAEKMERAARRFAKGLFSMNDMRTQLVSMQKMGGVESIMSNMPGMKKFAGQMHTAGDPNKSVDHMIAMINSMTRKERANPKILNAGRRKRIAKGAGVEISELNKLLKAHRQMADVTKRFSKGGMKGAIDMLMGKLGNSPGGFDPSAISRGNFPTGSMDGLPTDFPKGLNLPGNIGNFGRNK